MSKSGAKQLIYRRMRLAYSLLIRTADDPPTHLHQAQRVREVLTDLAWLLMGPPINLDNDLVVEKGKISDMVKAKERMLRSVAPS